MTVLVIFAAVVALAMAGMLVMLGLGWLVAPDDEAARDAVPGPERWRSIH